MKLSGRRKWLLVCGALALVTAMALGALERVAWSKMLGPEGHCFDAAGVRIHYTDEGG